MTRMHPSFSSLKAKILRAEAAHALGDDALAASLLAEVGELGLAADDRAALADDLARADELRIAMS